MIGIEQEPIKSLYIDKEIHAMWFINIKEMEFKNNTFEPVNVEYMNFTHKPEEFQTLADDIINKHKHKNPDWDIVKTPMSDTQTVCIFYQPGGLIAKMLIIYLSDKRFELDKNKDVNIEETKSKRVIEDLFKNYSDYLNDNQKRLLIAQYMTTGINTEKIKEMIKLGEELNK